jgi:hypothetical protein
LKVLIIGTAVAATIVKLYLAYTTNGSLDVLGFEDWRDKIQALGILG